MKYPGRLCRVDLLAFIIGYTRCRRVLLGHPIDRRGPEAGRRWGAAVLLCLHRRWPSAFVTRRTRIRTRPARIGPLLALLELHPGRLHVALGRTAHMRRVGELEMRGGRRGAHGELTKTWRALGLWDVGRRVSIDCQLLLRIRNMGVDIFLKRLVR